MIKCVHLSQQDLQIRGSGGGGAVIQTLRKGGGGEPSLKKIVFGPKIKERGLAPPLDPLVKFNLSYLFQAFARPH